MVVLVLRGNVGGLFEDFVSGDDLGKIEFLDWDVDEGTLVCAVGSGDCTEGPEAFGSAFAGKPKGDCGWLAAAKGDLLISVVDFDVARLSDFFVRPAIENVFKGVFSCGLLDPCGPSPFTGVPFWRLLSKKPMADPPSTKRQK